MSIVNALHVDLDRAGDTKGGGNYPTLKSLADQKRVKMAPWNETDISANGQYNLLDSTGFSGTIALGTTSEETDGGYHAAALAGAVGTAATTNITDTDGNITNLVDVRDATSHDPILDSNDRTVYGLLQAASTVTDGDAVGAAASENIQVSYIVIGDDGTLALTSVTATVEVMLPVLYALRHTPAYAKEISGISPDIIDPTGVGEPVVRSYVVTAAFAADEVITVSAGSGAGTGTSTPSGDTITSLGADASTFNTTNTTRVRIEGLGQVTKGVNATWDSATTFHFSVALSIGDRFSIEMAG